MLREFEIFSKPAAPSVAVKRGFCWPAFFVPWIWALARGLWLQGGLVLLCSLGLLAWRLWGDNPVIPTILGFVLSLIVGFKGNAWRSRKLEQSGYNFVGIVEARSPAAALAIAARGGQPPSRSGSALPSFLSVPSRLQGLLAIALLTWKAAFRFRLFLAIAGLLLASVIALPILIKDDGTARGFTQILLTYTLSVITALLGLSTLWLSCGTLARDIEECQMQVVAVKPVGRWQIWFGKWLGILSLNAALLALAGGCVYGLLQWRATKLPADQQQLLRNVVLVARGSAKAPALDARISEMTERVLQERLKQSPVTVADLPEVRRQIREQVKAEFQLVRPGTYKTWKIDLGAKDRSRRDQPLQLRIKFNSAQRSPTGTFDGYWQVGVPPKIWRNQEPMSLAPDTYHEFEVPADLLDENGVLTISFANPNDTWLLFPLEDGMEVLYREGGFGLNFARGLGIIFCWMALLAAIGLAAASFLSFPVAAFFSLSLLTVALSSSTLANVVSEGSIIPFNSETGARGFSAIDFVVVPAFKAVLSIINLATQTAAPPDWFREALPGDAADALFPAPARSFSPVDALSTGRSIPWKLLFIAFVQIVVLLGGIFAAFGIFVFNRRELATAQGNQ